MFDHLPEDNDKPLTAKQKGFVDKFIETRSNKMAAEAVGITESTGTKWRSQPNVRAAIESAEQDSAMRAGVSSDWLIAELKEVALLAKDDGSWAAAIKGLETLAKINGLFDEGKNDGISYNVMGSVILAPNAEAAQALLSSPNVDLDGDYEVMDFNIGEDVDDNLTE